MKSIFNTLRGGIDRLSGGGAAAADTDAGGAGAEEAERPAKQPRIGYGSPLMRSGAPNKHEGPALLQSLLRAYPHEGLVTSPSPAPAAKPVPPGSFYGLNGAGGGAAAGAAMFRQSIEALKQKQPTEPAPRACPRRAAHVDVPGSSRDVPLEISDDEEPVVVVAAPPPPQPRRTSKPADDFLTRPLTEWDGEVVTVESKRAWIGVRQASTCRLDFYVDKIVLWASLVGASDLFYELPREGFITNILSAYKTTDSNSWPSDWCGVVAVECSDWPDEEIAAFFDPKSLEPQRRALCCLFLDNDTWVEAQRVILAMHSWDGIWTRLNAEQQYELLKFRKNDFKAGGKRSARQRARERRAAAPLLAAPLVYPPGDVDAITLTNADLARLEVSEFLNDNLVDFCLKRLQEELAARLAPAAFAKRFHFFNCFFFKRLAEDVDPLATTSRHRGGAARADAAHARVRKWTSRVDLFEKDFLVVPVNQSMHWTLAIVCHPGAAERRAAQHKVEDLTSDVIQIDDDEPVDDSGPSPCIIQLNSMNGTHANVEGVLRDYLAREWAARRHVPLERGVALFGPAGPVQFRRAAVPQQPNFYDCGLFLVEYARRFCLAAPTPHLSLRAQDGWPYFLTPAWFQPDEAGEAKRDAIRADVLSLAQAGGGGGAGSAGGAGGSGAAAAAPEAPAVAATAPVAAAATQPASTLAHAAAASPAKAPLAGQRAAASPAKAAPAAHPDAVAMQALDVYEEQAEEEEEGATAAASPGATAAAPLPQASPLPPVAVQAAAQDDAIVLDAEDGDEA